MQCRLSGFALTWLVAASVLAAAPDPASGPTAATASDAASAPAAPGHRGATPKSKAASAPAVKLVDINSASRKELKTLPGIGDAEADKIIANRPYLSKTELVGKNVLPVGPYLSLKNQIIAKQNRRTVVKP